MEDKIKRYVEYHFRFKKGKEKEELVDEVYSNLLDRYHALKDKYENEEKAYREAIARMGDFSNIEADRNPEYSLLPGIYDLGLITAMVLAIFSFAAIFLHASLAFILIVLSIVLFVASAYYTYHLAQYEKNVNGDIDTFHLYLDKSFSYLKTAFIFWALTFTLLLGQLFANIVMFMNASSNPFEVFNNLGELILVYLLSFLVAASIIGVLFYLLYERVMEHYRYISGKDYLEGSFTKGINMIQGGDASILNKVRPFVPWFALMIAVLSLFPTGVLAYPSGHIEGPALALMFELLLPRYYFSGLLLIIGYGLVFYSIVKSIKNKEHNLKWILISFLGTVGAYILVAFLSEVIIEEMYLAFMTAFNPAVILLIGSLLIGLYALLLRIKVPNTEKTE